MRKKTNFYIRYEMSGEDVGSLGIKYQTNEEESPYIWMQSGSHGEKWRKGSVQIQNMKTPYDLLLEGIVGSSTLGNIAIDDFILDFHACPIDESMTCNFENDLCNFKNKGDVQWERKQAKDVDHVDYDHTYFSQEGYLLVLDLSKTPEGHGVLEGSLHAGGKKACVHSYYLVNSENPVLLKICAKKIEDDEDVNCQEQTFSGTRHHLWRYMALDIDTEGAFLETEEWMVRYF